MSAFDKYPLGKPAFVTHVLDRAAHLRTNDEKLFTLEGQHNARAYVVYRDSLLVRQEADRSRALLAVKEALGLGANPGTIFFGLRDGAPVFGMGISAAAAEKLMTRADVAVTELRGMAMQGTVPLEQLSAIAMAKSLVSWHQRHGFCANCGAAHLDEGGWLEARMCELQGRAFSAHRSRRDNVCEFGRQGVAGPAKTVHARHAIRALPASLKRRRLSRTPFAAKFLRKAAFVH